MLSSTDLKSIDACQSISQALSVPQLVINTRPVERAAPLTQCLQAAGLTVIDMPMLTLQSRAMTDGDMVTMCQWLAGAYKALVVVSPTAAASGLAAWQALKCEVQDDSEQQVDKVACETLAVPSPLIAVGDATAAVLKRAKLNTTNYQVRQPKIANNEGMLAMPEIERLQAGDKLLIWRGLGGRRLLVDTLQARGVHIDSIAWYERVMPIEATAQYQQWLQEYIQHNVSSHHTPQNITSSSQPKPIVIVSSGTAFEHWTTVVNETAKNAVIPNMALTLSDFAYVVLGERLTHWVAKQQLTHWRVDDLSPETILTAIVSNT
ncbi:uroporphyrinogen-III synthase [Psychrobacter alimentarius]|uniref:uroporphyrinogen-III synthase n=1 Tax=Psychrobacter alimentarius TaxID=261164 RepID=UPI003FD4EEC0